MTDPGSYLPHNFEPEYSKEDLLKLLLQFEAELEKKEEELINLKVLNRFSCFEWA